MLSVVGFHAFPGKLPGGFVGVDIFFVISGYLISSIILQGCAQQTFSFLTFYARRIKRIFPALILVLASCLGAGWLLLLPDEYAQLGKHIFSGAVFVSNFTLWGESGYFDNLVETKPLLHLWSLGIEEQFYIVWPAIIFLALKKRSSMGLFFCGVLVTSFTFCVWQTWHDPVAAFYSPLSRFWELLVGSVLAFYRPWQTIRAASSRHHVASLLGLLLIVLSLFLITKNRPFPGWLAALPTVAAALLLWAGPAAVVNDKLLSTRLLVSIGLISFPLYLWHWPLLSFARVVEGTMPSVAIRLIAVGLAIILATVTYVLIEKPIRFRHQARWATPTLILCLVLVGAGGFSTWFKQGYPQRDSLEHVSNTDAVAAQFVGPNWAYTTNKGCLAKYPFAEAQGYDSWFCMLSSEAEPTILLLGSSYANQLYPGLLHEPAFKQATILSIGACDASGHVPMTTVFAAHHACSGDRPAHQRDFIDAIIQKTPSLKYVIMDGLPDNPDDEYIKNLTQRIDFIERSGKQVIIFAPHLRPGFHPKSCFSRPHISQENDCSFSIELWHAQTERFSRLVQSIKSSNAKVIFYDQNELFCANSLCSFTLDGMPLHRDIVHLSEYASDKVGALFSRKMRVALPGIFDAN